MKAYLILEDGTVFEGRRIGADRDVVCEVVFNTAMAGYLEVLTDPSYAGQGVAMTYPLMGNYGINEEDAESRRPWASAFIVQSVARRASNYRSEEELDTLERGTVIIRSHGVAKDVYDRLESKKIQIVDATCPFVKKIHNIVQKHSEMGENIIIIGNPEHPEVQGIKGWAGDHVEVFQTKEEAENYSCEQGKKICIVAQTTFNYNKFKELVEILEKKSYDVSVLNTICNATKERQTEAQSIAETVDAMIVIGDKHSSNTQKLFEICRKACNNTYYIQTLGDLDLNQLGSVETVGITAGASTPNNIIEEVQNNVRIIF